MTSTEGPGSGTPVPDAQALLGVVTLTSLMSQSTSEDRIMALALSSVPTVLPGSEVAGALVDSAWRPVAVRGVEHTARLVSAARSAEPFGGPVASTRGWGYGYPLGSLDNAIGVLVVERDQPPSPEEHFLLGLLVQQAGMAIGAVRGRNQERTGILAALQRSEQEFQSLALLADDVIYRFDLDAQRFSYLSPSIEAMTGYRPEEVYADPDVVGRVLHPDDAPAALRALRSVKHQVGAIRMRWISRDGELVWTEHRMAALRDESGEVTAVQGIARDVTADVLERESVRRRAQQQACVAQLSQHALTGASLDELLHEVADLVASSTPACTAAVFTHVGDHLALRARTGWPETPGEDVVLPLGPGCFGSVTLESEKVVHIPDLSAEDAEVRSEELVAAGFVSAAGVLIRGGPVGEGVLAAFTLGRERFDDDDLALLQAVSNVLAMAVQRLGSEREVAHRAMHDDLTGLPNRTLFVDRLEQALARAERSEQRVGMLFLDIDQFKLVNDSLGHEAGDRLLMAVAERLRDAVRPSDTVARFSGDEFAVLCDGVDERAVVRLAERISSAVAEPLVIGDREVRRTVSIGISLSRPGISVEELRQEADAAMYRAKHHGPRRWEVFGEAMRTEAVSRLDTETALRGAVERHELVLHYQPVLDLCALLEGRPALASTEALVRWPREGHGLVPPAHFIPQAEESTLILDLGSWAIAEACRAASAWADVAPEGRRPPGVAVNVSARQLGDPNLARVVAEALARHSLAPNRLCLEVTETTVMDDPEVSSEALRQLRDLGVLIAIDDFGTGYSSLAYLKRLPVDIIKIDRSFVDGLGSDGDDTAIVAAILSLAQTLNLLTVAEGVETEVQLHALQELGCDRAQGFLWSKAVPEGEIRGMLRAT